MKRLNSRIRLWLAFTAAQLVLLIIPAAYLSLGGSRDSADPVEILVRYFKATYARDYAAAYRLISSEDRRVKGEKTYIMERGAFNGFTLEVAKKVAGSIKATGAAEQVDGRRARIKLKFSLPDANKLSPILYDWDEDRLNTLSREKQLEIMGSVDRLIKEGKLSMISGEEDFNLVKEARGWRVFLDWAEGVRVIFNASVPQSVPVEAWPVSKETLVHPGEPFTIAFRVKNRSDRDVFLRIAHHVEPKSSADYLDLVECGLLFPVKLSPGQANEYSSTYFIRGDLPEGTKRLAVTYEFKPDER